MLPLVKRTTWKLAIAGSPEHIKLVMAWAGINVSGSQDHNRPPAMGVFINVPRPPPELEGGMPTVAALDAEHVRILEAADDGSVAAQVVTPREKDAND